MKRIFISHSSKDKYIVQSFMDDILDAGLGINVNDIFCTTIDGTKIPSGNDWRNEIKKNLEESSVTFLIITPHYKESEMCLNEMGAAWVLTGKTIPLFVEPINYDSVGILQEVKQVEKLRDGKSLDRIKDELQEILGIPANQIRSDRWSDKKESFLRNIEEYLRKNPFGIPVTKEQIGVLSDQVKNLREEKESLKGKVDELSEENQKLENLNTDLKSALSPTDAARIERNHLDLEKMDEFNFLCEKVKEALSQVHGVVQAIIFVDYSWKNLEIDFDNNDWAIRDARARDIITDKQTPNWTSTKIMRQINSSLGELKSFVDENAENREFTFIYESTHQYPLSLLNLGFWEEVLGLLNRFFY